MSPVHHNTCGDGTLLLLQTSGVLQWVQHDWGRAQHILCMTNRTSTAGRCAAANSDARFDCPRGTANPPDTPSAASSQTGPTTALPGAHQCRHHGGASWSRIKHACCDTYESCTRLFLCSLTIPRCTCEHRARIPGSLSVAWLAVSWTDTLLPAMYAIAAVERHEYAPQCV